MGETKDIELESELETLVKWYRESVLNEEQHKEAQNALFIFSIGLLCGLKQSKGGANA